MSLGQAWLLNWLQEAASELERPPLDGHPCKVLSPSSLLTTEVSLRNSGSACVSAAGLLESLCEHRHRRHCELVTVIVVVP